MNRLAGLSIAGMVANGSLSVPGLPEDAATFGTGVGVNSRTKGRAGKPESARRRKRSSRRRIVPA